MAAITIDRPAGTSGVLSTALATADRWVRSYLRTPQLVVMGTIQGAMFLLIFRYVFGGAIDGGGVPYVDFLVPGFVVTSVLFAGSSAAPGVATDAETGFHDRLRSLPIPRAGVLAGRWLADTVVCAWGLLVTVGIGYLVGFRLHGPVAAGVGAFGLCVLFGAVFAWVFIVIGLVSGSAQAATGMSMLVFPLTFVSSAYVRVETMPGWLQPVARHQPLTVMTDAVRSLALGQPAGSAIVQSLLWSAAIVVVFAPLAVTRFSR